MNTRILTTIAFFISTFSVFSQDIIIQHSGEEIKTKILEVNETNIKYKKFENIEGPTYTMEKASVFMIKYENGSKDVFKTDNKPKKATKPPKVKSTFDFKANRPGGYWGIHTTIGHAEYLPVTSVGYAVGVSYANYFNGNVGFKTGVSFYSFKEDDFTLSNQNFGSDFTSGNVRNIGIPVKLLVTTSGRVGYYFEVGATMYTVEKSWSYNIAPQYNYSTNTYNYNNHVNNARENYSRLVFEVMHAVRYDFTKKITANLGISLSKEERFRGYLLGGQASVLFKL